MHGVARSHNTNSAQYLDHLNNGQMRGAEFLVQTQFYLRSVELTVKRRHNYCLRPRSSMYCVDGGRIAITAKQEPVLRGDELI